MTTKQDTGSRTEEHTAPREAWDAIAVGYDRYVAPQEAALADEALRLVALQAGERFLDVAAGTGGLSLPAARLGAEVLATDWSAAMIEQFEARVREESLSHWLRGHPYFPWAPSGARRSGGVGLRRCGVGPD